MNFESLTENFLKNIGCIPNKKNDFGADSVYEESMEMVAAATIVYIVADLRDMARKGKLSDDKTEDTSTIPDFLEVPLTTAAMMDAIEANQDHLVATGSYPNIEDQVVTLNQIYKHSKSEDQNGLLSVFLTQSKKQSQVVDFQDKNADSEMVYAITVDDFRKRITVIFRGSVTTNDFLTDLKSNHKKIENPVHKLDPKTPESVKIHTGFLEYLLKVDNETQETRMDEILKKVMTLLEEYPGYRLYFTGHSLGGALSTLAGFYAASHEPFLEKHGDILPVRVITVASPYVGDPKFLLSFQSLERHGRIQHLRIANAEDTVTLLPFMSASFGLISPVFAMVKGLGELYKHTGIKLRLSSKDDEVKFSISYQKDQKSDANYVNEVKDFIQDGQNLLNATKLVINKDVAKVTSYHSCDEYELRLQKCKDALQGMTIDGLYKDKNIVGEILDEDYEPHMMRNLGERIARLKESEQLRNDIWKLFNNDKDKDKDKEKDKDNSNEKIENNETTAITEMKSSEVTSKEGK